MMYPKPVSLEKMLCSRNNIFFSLDIAGRNEFRFLRLINILSFSFLAAGVCPKNLAFARKIMALSDSGGAAPG